MCDLARAGKEVERKPRQVRIHQIEILDMDLPRVRMSVFCSKGTYIRTLCHDIGEKLGCHGCMERLLRTRSGMFCLERSVTLSEVEKLRDEGRLDEIIQSVDEVFKGLASVTLKEESQKLGYNGNPFKKSDVEQESEALGEVRVYDQEGRFIGIYRYDQERHSYRPVKMFYGK